MPEVEPQAPKDQVEVFCAKCGETRVVKVDEEGTVQSEIKKCSCPPDEQPEYPVPE